MSEYIIRSVETDRNPSGSNDNSMKPIPPGEAAYIITILIIGAILLSYFTLWCSALYAKRHEQETRSTRSSSTTSDCQDNDNKIRARARRDRFDKIVPESDLVKWRISRKPTGSTFAALTTHPTCAICLFDIDDKDKIRALPCQHVFHSKCIVECIQAGYDVCPLCKQDIGLKEQDEAQAGIEQAQTDPAVMV